VAQLPLKLRRPRDELRNHPGNRDDFDVIDGDGKIVGRILRPFGHEGWQWNLFAVVPRPLRNTGTASTRAEAAAAFRATCEQSVGKTVGGRLSDRAK